jgi:hypothetical protein
MTMRGRKIDPVSFPVSALARPRRSQPTEASNPAARTISGIGTMQS